MGLLLPDLCTSMGLLSGTIATGLLSGTIVASGTTPILSGSMGLL